MNDFTHQSLGTIFQALADSTRRAVIERLGAGPASTKELASPFDMKLPSFLEHLNTLENSGLIASRKVGRVRTWQLDQVQLDAAKAWFVEQQAVWETRTDNLVDYVEDLYKREIIMTGSNLDFTVNRLIKAPRRIVWQAWTRPEHLEKWWCPKPMTTKVLNFDLRAGGAFDIMMGTPGGEQTPITGAFLEIVPEERIVFTTALTEGWRPAPALLPITAIISMTDDIRGTRYTTQVLIKDEEERQKLEKMNFEVGWSIGIDQLSDLVEQPA